jgi:hypothetical protein
MNSDTPMGKFSLMAASMINSCFLPSLVEFINKRNSEEPLTVEECIKVLESQVDKLPQMVPAQQILGVNPPIGKAKTGAARFATSSPIEGKQCIHKFAKPKALVGMCCGITSVVTESSGRFCKKHYDQFLKNESKRSDGPISKPGPSDIGKTIIANGLAGMPPTIGTQIMTKPANYIPELNIFDSSRNLLINPVNNFVVKKEDNKIFVIGVNTDGVIRKLIPEEREMADTLDYMINDDEITEGVKSNKLLDLPVAPIQIPIVPETIEGVPSLEIESVNVPIQITLE